VSDLTFDILFRLVRVSPKTVNDMQAREQTTIFFTASELRVMENVMRKRVSELIFFSATSTA
jgi:hypothetical protein